MNLRNVTLRNVTVTLGVTTPTAHYVWPECSLFSDSNHHSTRPINPVPSPLSLIFSSKASPTPSHVQRCPTKPREVCPSLPSVASVPPRCKVWEASPRHTITLPHPHQTLYSLLSSSPPRASARQQPVLQAATQDENDTCAPTTVLLTLTAPFLLYFFSRLALLDNVLPTQDHEPLPSLLPFSRPYPFLPSSISMPHESHGARQTDTSLTKSAGLIYLCATSQETGCAVGNSNFVDVEIPQTGVASSRKPTPQTICIVNMQDSNTTRTGGGARREPGRRRRCR